MLNWREIPFVRILAAYIAGILFSFSSGISIPAVVTLPIVLVALIWASKKLRGTFRLRWLFGLMGLAFFFLLGYQRGFGHDERNNPQYPGAKTIGQIAIIIGKINDAPIRKGDWIRLVLKTTMSGSHPDSLTATPANILVYVERGPDSEKIAYGDVVCFKTHPQPIPPPGNPHAFDYRRYLHFKNIHLQAFVHNGDWEILSKEQGNIFFSKAIALQEYFLNILKKHIKGEKELAVGAALILGHRDEIPQEVQLAYSQTGAMHVLAVSGLHVGIVFLILNFLLKKVKRNTTGWSITKALIILLAIWSFALVTGASPSVVRAAVMFSFVNIGLAVRRHPRIYNTLAGSAFIMLLFDPFLIASVGFQLSYLAVLGIVYFQPRIVKLWRPGNKLVNYVWQLTSVSIAAQLMTLPLTFYYFNQLPVYFWLSGLVMVPLAGFELAAGLALLFLQTVFPPLAIWIGKLLDSLLWFGNICVFYIQQLPAAVVGGIWVSGLAVLFLYLFIASLMAAISSRRFKWIVCALGFLLTVSLTVSFKGINNTDNRQLVIYKIYKHSAIDFFDGKKVFSITGKNVDEKSFDFATRGHRYAMGVKSEKRFYFETTSEHTFGHFYFKNNFIKFFDIKIIVIDPTTIIPEHPFNIEVDYVLIRNTPDVVPDELEYIFNFKKIIFDNSNKKWKVEKWKKQCSQSGIDFYDIATRGAFVLEIK